MRETEQQAFVLDIHVIHICAAISSSKLVCWASVNIVNMNADMGFFLSTETMKILTKCFCYVDA